MANQNVTTLVRVLTTPLPLGRRNIPGGSGSGGAGGQLYPVPPRVRGCFTAAELAAAQQLVLLSESSCEDAAVQAGSRSSSSSSFPSVTSAPADPPVDEEEEEDEEEGICGVPGIRSRRYRSIRDLYEATRPIGAPRGGEVPGAAPRGKKKKNNNSS